MSDDKLSAGKFINFMREKKSLWLISAALVLGIILILYGNYSGPAKAVSGSVSNQSADDYELRLESRVKTLCEQVSGVSDVSVMLTLVSMSEQVFAQNMESSESETQKELRRVYIQVGGTGTQELVPTKELSPCVRGVAVVCAGGDDANIQLKLTKLISSLFGIPSSSVSVVGGK